MASDEYALTIPRIEVTLDDGSVHTVQALNPDLVRWDRNASKMGWPRGQDAPFMWLTFLAWSAMKRTGQLDPADMAWDVFSDTKCIQVRNVTDADSPNGVDAVDPIPLAVEQG